MAADTRGYVALPYLRARREGAYLSQRQLAERAGLSKYTVLSIKNGRYRASYQSLHALADALGLTVKQLVEEEPV